MIDSTQAEPLLAMPVEAGETVGVLASGGIDSCVLIATLLRQQYTVQPFYVQSSLCWQHAETRALRQFLDNIISPLLRKLIVFELPLADVYDSHWSLTGRGTPSSETSDEAVYLPARNALLLLKPAVWCQLRSIRALTIASLEHNPFHDASKSFLDRMESILNLPRANPVHLAAPMAHLSKHQVIKLGRDLPLHLTMSCISPRDGKHCGQCNKCGERRRAFHASRIADVTQYSGAVSTLTS